MLKITGNTWRYAPDDVPLLDWREAGLRKPCVVRCDKVARITADDIAWDDTPVYGRLSHQDALRVAVKVMEIQKRADSESR
ncbi:hypothetical protein H7U32_04720 [Bifidobacterium pullorum subsp. saeculare]|uniref:Uncharacterized protein n=1 Tax=Bifidobacterium pullorum subsp. saeculare TaxID=78257 RepID=A0A938WZS4_9BIFI|nr:hypothetical protein [Bifidobacterium pullorum]MBM6699627.1 hypothetical protein [Bifidobacterium pullorum subsp. saeculare]